MQIARRELKAVWLVRILIRGLPAQHGLRGPSGIWVNRGYPDTSSSVCGPVEEGLLVYVTGTLSGHFMVHVLLARKVTSDLCLGGMCQGQEVASATGLGTHSYYHCWGHFV